MLRLIQAPLLAATLLLSSCDITSKGTSTHLVLREEVVYSYPKDKPFSGVYENSEASIHKGLIHKSVPYKNGVKHGTLEFLYDNGKPYIIAQYNKGVLDGLTRIYDVEGYLEEETVRKGGVLVSTKLYQTGKLSFEQTLKANTEFNVTSYWPNGNIEYQGTIKDGQLDGNFKEFNESGDLQASSNYRMGRRDGQTTTYQSDGTPSVNINYISGKPQGEISIYYPDGQVKFKTYAYSDGDAFLYRSTKYNLHPDGLFKDDNTISIEGVPDSFFKPKSYYRYRAYADSQPEPRVSESDFIPELHYSNYYSFEMLPWTYDATFRMVKAPCVTWRCF
ncbi:hypothetical protein OAM26_05445 [Porticoccaceae bacterium]|nr:hypothetical protein [Porticoccaceae bacterium]